MRQDGGPALNVVVRLASGLREHAGGADRIEVEVAAPAILADVLDALAARAPAVGRRIRDETGELRPHVNVFVGTQMGRDLDGMATAVEEGVEVSVLAAVSGG